MTQTQETLPPNADDRVARAPAWLMRWVAHLALFSGFVLSLSLGFSGAFAQGLLAFGATLLLLPILLLILWLIWRFYWYIITVFLVLQIFVFLSAWWGITMNTIRLPRGAEGLMPLIGKSSPFGVILAILIAGLATASVARIYTLWQTGGLTHLLARLRRPERPGDGLFNFDVPGTTFPSHSTVPLGERVMKHLSQMGHRGEQQGDLIHVYKQRDFVGIVRVVESAGAISPVIVRDVEKQRAKLGVKVAYLATVGWFTEDVRHMADQIGVRLITV